VLTTVGLVLLVTVLVSAVTTVAVRAYLIGQLDDQVVASAERARQPPVFVGPGTPGSDSPRPDHERGPEGREDDIGDRRGQGVGTLTAVWRGPDDPGTGDVIVQGREGTTTRPALSTAALAALHTLPVDGRPRTVDVPGVGSYRVAVDADDAGGGKIAAGLPVGDVGDTVTNLVAWQSALTLAGGVLAVVAGLLLVRRELRPLRQVAATAHDVARVPLAEGDIDLAHRVPAHLTDEDTEVGLVGGALNTLLDHVESSLTARHRSEQQVRQFVADASHELRTPLATIAGYSELVRRQPDDEQTLRTALAKVDEESARMTSLVEDLLLLARLDSGRSLRREKVDLTRLLLEAASDARVVSPSHHWLLELPDHVVEVVGDEQRLHQVVTNLLVNAGKHTPAGTTVTISAWDGGFAVHDDGPGFPPDLVATAFERFTRGDTARQREGGVGLGLALVAAIVTAHAGTVSLDSRPGGTTVTVSLPADGRLVAPDRP
jgi:two-component system OmpR family sensor kinase